jgi:hypothetical protein
MAKNNIYPAFESVYKRYAKVPIHIVAGNRVDPQDSTKNVGWTLSTKEENFDIEKQKRTEFVYEDEVIEIYTPLEDKMFQRFNKSLFSLGLLKEYDQESLPPDMNNFLNDSDVLEIVEMKSLTELAKRLQLLTSVATLQRIRELAVSLNKTIRKIQIIDDRIKAVEDDTD